VDALKEPKDFVKAREGTTSPICLPHPPFSAATIFCMSGRTVDVIKRAKFQVNWFRSFGAPGIENDPSSLTWHIALIAVYAVTCYTVIHGNFTLSQCCLSVK